MEHLFSQINNTGSILVLTSASKGLVLHSLGDRDFSAGRQTRWPWSLGSIRSEQAQGTNAIGTALQQNAKPSPCKGPNTLCRPTTAWPAHVPPFFGPHGQLMGALDVTSEHHRHHPHPGAGAHGRCRCWKTRCWRRSFRRPFAFTFMHGPNFWAPCMEGIAVFSPDGQLLSLNRSAQFQCSLTDAQPQSVPTQHFSMLFRHPLTELLQAGAQQLMLDSGVLVACRIHLPHSTEAVPRPTAAAGPQPHNTPTTRPSGFPTCNTWTRATRSWRHHCPAAQSAGNNISVMLLGGAGTGRIFGLARAPHQDRPGPTSRLLR